MTVETTESRQPLAIGRIALYGLIAIAGSVVANLIVRAIGMAIIDVSPEFEPLSDLSATVVFTAGLVLVAVIVFAIVDRFTKNPVRVYNIIALVALLVSLIPDIMLLVSPDNAPFGGITFGAVVVLMVMHVVAYAVTVYTLTVLAYRQ